MTIIESLQDATTAKQTKLKFVNSESVHELHDTLTAKIKWALLTYNAVKCDLWEIN